MSRLRTRSARFTLTVGVEPAEAFAIFSDIGRLNQLTPSWFRLDPEKGPPAQLELGSRIAYRFRWRLLRLRWQSRITDWQPPHDFAYEQERGPFCFFRHEHTFEPVPGGTRVVDVVTFATAAGGMVDRWLVEPDLRRVFEFRRALSERLFALDRRTLTERIDPLTATPPPPSLGAHALD